MKIAFGCDHAAFSIKKEIMDFLRSGGHEVTDFGCFSEDSCDYPDFGIPAARSVAGKKCDRAVLVCGTGVGMSMLANKIKGIRAAVCWDVEIAKLVSEHNDANVLCLPARFLKPGKMAECISAWLTTPFSGNPRHKRRIEKIMELEK